MGVGRGLGVDPGMAKKNEVRDKREGILNFLHMPYPFAKTGQ